jgi:hypothetical protein
MPIEANKNFCFLFPIIHYNILTEDASVGEMRKPLPIYSSISKNKKIKITVVVTVTR